MGPPQRRLGAWSALVVVATPLVHRPQGICTRTSPSPGFSVNVRAGEPPEADTWGVSRSIVTGAAAVAGSQTTVPPSKLRRASWPGLGAIGGVDRLAQSCVPLGPPRVPVAVGRVGVDKVCVCVNECSCQLAEHARLVVTWAELFVDADPGRPKQVPVFSPRAGKTLLCRGRSVWAIESSYKIPLIKGATHSRSVLDQPELTRTTMLGRAARSFSSRFSQPRLAVAIEPKVVEEDAGLPFERVVHRDDALSDVLDVRFVADVHVVSTTPEGDLLALLVAEPPGVVFGVGPPVCLEEVELAAHDRAGVRGEHLGAWLAGWCRSWPARRPRRDRRARRASSAGRAPRRPRR